MLCTDIFRLQQLAEGSGFPLLMISEACSFGSNRIASVDDQLVACAWNKQADQWFAAQRAQRLTGKVVINVKGYQPFLDLDVVTTIAGKC